MSTDDYRVFRYFERRKRGFGRSRLLKNMPRGSCVCEQSRY